MSKLNSEAFPYPVLTDQEDNDDYYDSFFTSNISIKLKEDENKAKIRTNLLCFCNKYSRPVIW